MPGRLDPNRIASSAHGSRGQASHKGVGKGSKSNSVRETSAIKSVHSAIGGRS